jgi:hypothetical protein
MLQEHMEPNGTINFEELMMKISRLIRGGIDKDICVFWLTASFQPW